MEFALFHHDGDQTLEQGTREAVGSFSLGMLKTQLGEVLNNLL